MDRRTFEKLKEKKRYRRGLIEAVVYGTCFFCGVLTLSYLFFGGDSQRGSLTIRRFDIPPIAETNAAKPKLVALPGSTIKGDTASEIYYPENCEGFYDIPASSVVWFNTKAEAEKAGFIKTVKC